MKLTSAITILGIAILFAAINARANNLALAIKEKKQAYTDAVLLELQKNKETAGELYRCLNNKNSWERTLSIIRDSQHINVADLNEYTRLIFARANTIDGYAGGYVVIHTELRHNKIISIQLQASKTEDEIASCTAQ